MAVTYFSRKREMPYKTRLTGRLMLLNEGFGVTRRTLRLFGTVIPGLAKREPGSSRSNLDLPGSMLRIVPK